MEHVILKKHSLIQAFRHFDRKEKYILILLSENIIFITRFYKMHKSMGNIGD